MFERDVVDQADGADAEGAGQNGWVERGDLDVVDVEALEQLTCQREKRVEAIVLSMTPHERAMPHVISMPRRRRIAAGSGTSLEEVNKLMAARKQMAKMMKQMGKGKMPGLPPELTRGQR